jgi:uncharacterized membrane protein YfcA
MMRKWCPGMGLHAIANLTKLHNDLKESLMKDGLLLLITGLVCAGFSWLFFKYMGKDAFSVLTLVVMVGAVADNARLRRRLRAMGAKPEGKRTWL